MFIKFLIVIFVVFIIYLLFSTNTFQEGFKGKKRKLRLGKKGGLKMRGGSKKKPTPAADPDEEDADPDAVDEVDQLPTIDELPQLVNDLRLRVDTIGTQVEGLLAEKPTISASAMEEEPEDGDLGL